MEDTTEKEAMYKTTPVYTTTPMFTVATTNMILRGDGKSNLQLNDMFAVTGEEMKK